MGEYRPVPADGRMTFGAIRRESRRDVIRFHCLLVIIFVARHAVIREIARFAAHVTFRAIQAAVTGGQWETSWVREERIIPRRGRVTLHTVRGESRDHVIRVRRVVVVVQVAIRTIGRKIRRCAGYVTLRTVDTRVSCAKREGTGMGKARELPAVRLVAVEAVCAEAKSCMVRIHRTLEVVKMARHTIRIEYIQVSEFVTFGTVERGMATVERERCGVGKMRCIPRCWHMAFLTILCPANCAMVR